MPPNLTDRERIAALENQMTNIDSELQSINGNIKAAALAAQVRHADADEVYRIVKDEKEGLQVRIRALENWQVEVKQLEAFVSGQIKAHTTQLKLWIGFASFIVSAISVLARFWPHK